MLKIALQINNIYFQLAFWIVSVRLNNNEVLEKKMKLLEFFGG